MFAQLAEAGQTEERLRNSAAGLASSLRLAGTGTQEPLWDRIPGLNVPLLALAGSDDTRFAAHALRLARLAPKGVASLIPGGGHAVHLAQPDVTGRIVEQWLAMA
jgi:2-succinyl-6-hydroxy-2,4-cyclohexadiene-1-carboxylate synthase